MVRSLLTKWMDSPKAAGEEMEVFGQGKTGPGKGEE